MSREDNREKDWLKLFAYGYLSSFLVDISTKEYEDEKEAKSILRLQDELIKVFETTLRGHFDETAVNEFSSFAKRYKVAIAH